jgi:hypothetical protein
MALPLTLAGRYLYRLMKKPWPIVLVASAALVALLIFVLFHCGDLSVPVVTDTLPPPAPVVVSAAASGCRGVTLTWNKAYDIHSVLKTYRIYRDGTLLAETHGTPEFLRANTREYRAAGLADATSYNFSVSAVDIYGHESTRTPFLSVVTLPANHIFCTDATPPSTPSGFTVTRVMNVCRTVAMTLAGPSTDGQSGLDHYAIYRDGLKVATTSTGNYGAERFGLSPGQVYAYWVRAVDKAGNQSAPGNVVHYAVPDCAAVVPGGNLQTLILAVNLPGRPVPSISMGSIEQSAFGPSMSMRGFYLETTYNRVSLTKAGVLGWIQLTANINTYCTQFNAGVGFNCNLNKVKTDALALAAASFGLNLNVLVHRYVIVVNGQAENKAGGDTVFLSDFDLGTAIHEMGHTFGIEHAAGWLGRKFDAPVGAGLALPVDFADLPFGAFHLSEYGDPYNRMGDPVINHFSVFQKELMGALPPSQVAHFSSDGNYRLEPVETVSTGNKALRIPVRPGAGTGKAPFLTAEYRNGKGYNAAAPQGGQSFRGVQLRLVPDRFFGAASDTVYVGEVTEAKPVFTDWPRRVKYTLIELDDDHAVLYICGLRWWSS